MNVHTSPLDDALIGAGHAAEHGDEHTEAGKTPLGFWIYLMSDCILFASLFATFMVLRDNLAGGPGAHDLFDLNYVAIETVLLLVSSLTYGMAMVSTETGNVKSVFVWLGITFALGLGFVGMEIHEFAKLVSEGAGPARSGFLSAFFTLVGTHGLHVTSGLVWMGVMFAQLTMRGLTAVNRTRLLCLSLFWHFLDIIWIGVFSIVYLMGAA